MPKISTKGHQMPASPIRKLVPSADIAKNKGHHVYHLNIGQPDIKSPEASILSLQNWHSNVIDYTKSEGTETYRNALASYYHRHGFTDLTERNFIATNGGSEALTFALSLLADAGDEIIIPEPFYANYNGFASQLDVKIVPISSSIESGFSLPDIASFEEKITPKTRAIVICHPGNPTGYVYTKEELEQLEKLVKKHDLFLISDEVYREFVYEGDYTSVLSIKGLQDHAIVIDSESKRYSLCGIRLGALITRNQEVLSTAMKFAQARLSPSLLSQEAAAAAHNDSNITSYLAEAKKEYLERRDFVVTKLNEIEGVFCPKPRGAFYCVAKLPVDTAENFAKWMLEEFEYKNETVMVAPAAGFYSTEESGLQEVRIAYVLNLSDLEKALTVLEKGLHAYPNRTTH